MAEIDEKDQTEQAFDPTSRRLCPDGSCVGVLGADGRCNECGRAPDGTVADGPRAVEAGSNDGPVAEHDGFDAARHLCDDGACIGVLRPDGTCPVCGRTSAVTSE